MLNIVRCNYISTCPQKATATCPSPAPFSGPVHESWLWESSLGSKLWSKSRGNSRHPVSSATNCKVDTEGSVEAHTQCGSLQALEMSCALEMHILSRMCTFEIQPAPFFCNIDLKLRPTDLEVTGTLTGNPELESGWLEIGMSMELIRSMRTRGGALPTRWSRPHRHKEQSSDTADESATPRFEWFEGDQSNRAHDGSGDAGTFGRGGSRLWTGEWMTITVARGSDADSSLVFYILH